jgi:hypothetical protein
MMPVTNTWSWAGTMIKIRNSHHAALLPNGKVLVIGRQDSSAELYDPGTNTWSAAASMNGTHGARRLRCSEVVRYWWRAAVMLNRTPSFTIQHRQAGQRHMR